MRNQLDKASFAGYCFAGGLPNRKRFLKTMN